MSPTSHFSLLAWATVLLSGVAQAAVTTTSPTTTQPVVCSAVTPGCNGPARQYCSSYLHLSVKTVTTTLPNSVNTYVTATSGTTQSFRMESSCRGHPTNAPEKRELDDQPLRKAKRQLQEPACLTSYPRGKPLSSACSCFSLTASTKTVTKRAAKGTITRTVPSSTEIITSIPLPACTAIVSAGPGVASANAAPSATFSAFFAGCGVTDNPNAPGNNVVGSQTISSDYTACQAAHQCVNKLPSSANAFNIYQLRNGGSWTCELYGGDQSNVTYYNVLDDGVLASYGFYRA